MTIAERHADHDRQHDPAVTERELRAARGRSQRVVMHRRAPDVPARLARQRIVDGEDNRLVVGHELQRFHKEIAADRIGAPSRTREEPMVAGEMLAIRARRDNDVRHGVTAETECPTRQHRHEVGEARRGKRGSETQHELLKRRYKRHCHMTRSPLLRRGHLADRRNGSFSLARSRQWPLNNGESRG